MSYHATVHEVYRKAAESPDASLCCVPRPPMYLPGLAIPPVMHQMNYGCGSTVHLQDMRENQTVLYVGVGGGLEALLFSYFARRPGGVIAVDPVAPMRQAARENLEQAARLNEWFDPSFVDVRDGDALDLPVEDASVHLAAQNCLFNIFEPADLRRALAEVHRVLRPHGRFVLSDPIAPGPLPGHLTGDERLRAMCLSGAITYERYMELLVEAGFGTIEVRARRPYRVLDPERFGVERPVLLESVEVAAIKDPIPADGPCIFTGRTAIWFGPAEVFDDGAGHVLQRDLPFPVCDKTAARLESLGDPHLAVTPSTWFYDGGGCC